MKKTRKKKQANNWCVPPKWVPEDKPKKHVHKYDRCFLGLKKGKHRGCVLTNIMCECGKVRHEKNS